MKLRNYVVGLLLLMGLLLVMPAAAQEDEDAETFAFDDETAFSYPSDWELESKLTYLTVQSDTTQVFVYSPTMLDDMGITGASAEAVLQTYFETLFGDDANFDADDIETLDLGGREAARYDYTDSFDSQGMLVAVQFSDEAVGVVDAVSMVGDLEDSDAVLTIAGSLNRGGEADIRASGSGVDCTITTDQRGTVAIRVGPGENRTSYAFLPAGEDFAVLGQMTDDDGGVWWKLDKETVAPGKAAAEAWVAEDAVDETGDCDAVIDASAPPVIPIIAAPPASGGESGGGDAGSSGGAPAVGDIIPQGGSWTVNYAATAPVSCLDVPTQQLPLGFTPDRYSLSVNGNGSTLTFGGDLYNRIGTNTYQGLHDVSDFGLSFTSVLFTLRVISPTTMTGEFILNFTLDGHQCSGTINSTITHN